MNRYQNIKQIKNSEGITYYRDSKYPIIPLSVNDIWVITTSEDRYDRLAQQYYNDYTLWWVISIANDNLPQNSLYPPEGTQIRIPTNVSEILSNYNKLNS
jgi:phosphorylcholine metabolism protein LicD